MTTSDTPTIMTPDETTEIQKIRSNAKFLRDCYNCLSSAEAEAVAKKLDFAADELAERDAALARCVEAMQRVVSDTVLDRQDADYYKRIILVHVEWLRETIASLPESAKQVAKVIEAAKRVADGPFRQDYEELCQAMRDLDK